VPSSATITAFYDFEPGTIIRSAQVDNNFNTFRGHIIPVHPNTATAGTSGSYDLGSEEHYWGKLHGIASNFAEQATSSSISTPGAGFLSLFAKDNSTLYIKDSSNNVTEVGAGGGGGGGGSSVHWDEGPSSPTYEFDDEIGKYLYGAGLDQALYGIYKVPSSYTPGTQLFLRLSIESDDTTGSINLFSETTLIRNGDTVSSTTNKYTSTASAINMSAGSSGIAQLISLDLMDASGLVNAVTVTANSVFKIKLKRGTDTSTADIKAHVHASEVS